MDGQSDSLRTLQQLLETWASLSRDEEIVRSVETLNIELRRRGYDVRFEMTRKGGTR